MTSSVPRRAYRGLERVSAFLDRPATNSLISSRVPAADFLHPLRYVFAGVSKPFRARLLRGHGSAAHGFDVGEATLESRYLPQDPQSKNIRPRRLTSRPFFMAE